MLSSSPRHAFLAFAALAALSTSSFAAIIGPGGFAPVAPGAPVIGGSLVITNTLPYSGLNTASQVVFSGTETSSVFAGDAANPFGGLTFVYQLTNSSGSPDAIDRISLSNFAGFATDVEFFGGGIAPSFADRSGNPGDVVGFDFFGATIAPGATTSTLIIRTNALGFASNTMSITDGGDGIVASFGAAVNGGSSPEPASLGIMGIGGLLLLSRRR